MNSLKILFLTIISFTFLNAQEVKLKGDFKQGSLIFGSAEGIQKILLDDEVIPHDESGNFVFGFDRDDSLEHLLVVKFANKTFLKKITPLKKEYNIQRINKMAQKYVEAPKEENERIEKEREIGKKARAKVGNVKDALFEAGFIKPIDGGRISSIFGSQRILKGTPVKAMSDGVVLLSADNFYYAGNYILIDHGLGLNSFYLHLSKSFVKENQVVKKGEVIGEVGTTGRSTGPHLHWGVQWFGKRVDPNSVFSFAD